MVKRCDTLIGRVDATLPYQTMKVIIHFMSCILYDVCTSTRLQLRYAYWPRSALFGNVTRTAVDFSYDCSVLLSKTRNRVSGRQV